MSAKGVCLVWVHFGFAAGGARFAYSWPHEGFHLLLLLCAREGEGGSKPVARYHQYQEQIHVEATLQHHHYHVDPTGLLSSIVWFRAWSLPETRSSWLATRRELEVREVPGFLC